MRRKQDLIEKERERKKLSSVQSSFLNSVVQLKYGGMACPAEDMIESGGSGPILVFGVNDIWIREPFRALGLHTPTVGLLPRYDRLKWLINKRLPLGNDAWVQREAFFMPRSFGRLSNWLAPITKWTLYRLCPNPGTVVLTYPHQRIAARLFKNAKLIYYAADNYETSYGFIPEQVRAWEQEIVERVDHIVVVSRALAEMFVHEYRVERPRLFVSPNGVPSSFIPAGYLKKTAPLPAPIPNSFRPLAGVLGTISSRLRLSWIREAVEALPWLHWAFVGPVSEIDPVDRKHVEALQSHPRCCFTGYQPYETLPRFAAAFDVGVIPLNDRGINLTSSPVRFFTQLPFGQPILATPGCRQLQEFEPLVSVCSDEATLIGILQGLRENDFDDGRRRKRWEASRKHTWEKRAEAILRLIGGAP